MIFQHNKTVPEPETLELKVKFQSELNVLLYYSLPLCILLANEKLVPWYYENFIELFSYNYSYLDPKYNITREGFVMYFLCDINTYRYNNNFYAHLAEEICLGYDLLKRETNITPFIIENLRKGYYVIAYLDEYYLRNKEEYQQNHYVHESLIYGYDDRQKEFLSIGFDLNHSFDMMKLDYRAVSKAFAQGRIYYKDYNGKWAETMAVRLIKPFEFTEEYPFDIKRYLEKLKKYLFPVNEPVRVYPFRVQENKTCRFGINVYDALIYHLKKLLQGRLTVAYKEVHFLYEHKKYIYSSLNYINHRYNINNGFDELTKKYLEIVNLMDNIRFIFLKVRTKKKIDLKSVQEMIRKVEKVKLDEENVLRQIIDFLEAWSNEVSNRDQSND